MTIAAITTIVGIVLFLVGDKVHADIKEIGRICLFAGLLAFLLGH